MRLFSKYFVVDTTTKFLSYCNFPSKPVYTLVCCLFLLPHTQTWCDWLQLRSSLCLVSRWFRNSIVHGYISEKPVLSFWGGDFSHTGPTVSKKEKSGRGRERKNTFLLASRQHSMPWRCLIPLGHPRTYCQRFLCFQGSLDGIMPSSRRIPRLSLLVACLYTHFPICLEPTDIYLEKVIINCLADLTNLMYHTLAIKRHLIEVRITG